MAWLGGRSQHRVSTNRVTRRWLKTASRWLVPTIQPTTGLLFSLICTSMTKFCIRLILYSLLFAGLMAGNKGNDAWHCEYHKLHSYSSLSNRIFIYSYGIKNICWIEYIWLSRMKYIHAYIFKWNVSSFPDRRKWPNLVVKNREKFDYFTMIGICI